MHFWVSKIYWIFFRTIFLVIYMSKYNINIWGQNLNNKKFICILYPIVQYSIIHYCTVQYCTVQYCIVTVLYSTVLYSTLLYSIVQYSIVQYSIVQYSIVQYSIVQYSIVQYSIVQYSIVQYSAVQYSTVQYSFFFIDWFIDLNGFKLDIRTILLYSIGHIDLSFSTGSVCRRYYECLKVV